MALIKKSLSSFVLVSILYINFAYAIKAFTFQVDEDSLKIGPEWGKLNINEDSFKKLNPALQKVASSVAAFKGGTAFYIGAVNGRHFMATNAHVVLPMAELSTDFSKYYINSELACLEDKENPNSARYLFEFSILKQRAKCRSLVGVWPEIEFAVIEIDVEGDDNWLTEIGIPLSEAILPNRKDKLSSFGYAGFLNKNMELQQSSDQDCHMFSAENDFRLLPDPDEINTSPYKVWSFSIGCDFIWGDSGSPVVDRATGAFVGIAWTRSTASLVGIDASSKAKEIHDRIVIEKWAEDRNEKIWNQLSYAVPSGKIREITTRGKIDHISDDSFKIIKHLLGI